VRTRLGLLERAAGTGALLVPAHIRGASGMTIAREGDRYRPAFVG
jgi:hypothetical protein